MQPSLSGVDQQQQGMDDEELDIDAFFLPGGILDPGNVESEGELKLFGLVENLSPSPLEDGSRCHQHEHKPLYGNFGRGQCFSLEDAQNTAWESDETVNAIENDKDASPGLLLETPPPPPPQESSFVDTEINMLQNHILPETTSLELSQQKDQRPQNDYDDDHDERPTNVVIFQTSTTTGSTNGSLVSPTPDSQKNTSQNVPDDPSLAMDSIDEGPGLKPDDAKGCFTSAHSRSSPNDEFVQNNASSEDLSAVSSNVCPSDELKSLARDAETGEVINKSEATKPLTVTIAKSYHSSKIWHLSKEVFSICFLGPYRSAEDVVINHLYPSFCLLSETTLRWCQQLLQQFIMMALVAFRIISALFSNAFLACFSTNIIFKPFSVSFYAPSSTACIYMIFLLTPSMCDILMHCLTLPHFFPHILSSFALFSCFRPEHQNKTKVPGRLSFLILSKLRWVVLYILCNEGFEKPNISPMVCDASSRVSLAFCLSILHNALVLSPLAWVTLSIHHLSVSFFGSSLTLSWILGIFSLAALQFLNSSASRIR